MWHRLSNIFRRNGAEAELSEQVAFHLDMLAEEKRRAGLSDEEAQLAARREFGGVEQMKERYRDAHGIPMLETFVRDCVYGCRMMRRNAGITSTIAITLALGIGASTAVFTVANAILFRPIDIPHAERAVVLLSTNPKENTAFSVAEGVFADWRAAAMPSFELMGAAWNTSMIFSSAGQPTEVGVARATAAMLSLLGVTAREGRLYDASAERDGADDVAVVSDGFRLRTFGQTPVVGKKITLDDRAYTIIGVAPAGAQIGYHSAPDFWLPLVPRFAARGGGGLTVAARLKPGVSTQAAQSEIDTVHSQVKRTHQEDSPFGVKVRSWHDWIVAEARLALLAACGAVAILLAICCINIANLLLARATARQHEFAIRASLGGGRARLMMQVFTECLLLCCVGGLAGWALAHALVRAVPHIKGFYLPRAEEVKPDATMLGIALATTLGSAFAISLFPALHARATAGIQKVRESMQVRRALVVGQLALAAVLLCAAGLLINTVVRLKTADVGFSGARIISAGVRLPYRQYDRARTNLFHRRLMEEVAALPGVESVSAADHVPLQAVLFPVDLWVPGSSQAAPVQAFARHVELRYFDTLGIRLVKGREFIPSDEGRVPIPVVINEEAGRRLFGDTQPIGRTLRTQYRERKLLEIIGVARSVRQLGLKTEPGPQIYFPAKLSSPSYTIARLAPNAGDLSNSIRQIVFRLDPAVPVPDISDSTVWYEFELARPRFYLLLLGAFAATALLLVVVGIYGVVSFVIARRTKEFGVRMTLGAQQGDIFKLVLSREALFVLLGIAVGIAAGLAGTRLLESLLYGVKSNDASTFAAAAIVLAAAALGSACFAARKATRLQPSVALRHDT